MPRLTIQLKVFKNVFKSSWRYLKVNFIFLEMFNVLLMFYKVFKTWDWASSTSIAPTKAGLAGRLVICRITIEEKDVGGKFVSQFLDCSRVLRYLRSAEYLYRDPYSCHLSGKTRTVDSAQFFDEARFPENVWGCLQVFGNIRVRSVPISGGPNYSGSGICHSGFKP